MRISFDIDDTLVLYQPDGLVEVADPWWWRWRYPERLRFGTKTLMQALTKRGHEVCIYTTSGRALRYLRGWFHSIDVHLVEAINQDKHNQVVRKLHFPGYTPSKFPPAFNIDLHVDDSEGVAMVGREHDFRVIVLRLTTKNGCSAC